MQKTLLRIGVAWATAFAVLPGAAVAAGAAGAPPAATAATSASTQAPPSTVILDACASAIGNQPRTAMQGCLKARLKRAQDDMRAAYATVESGLKQIDSAATPEALRALKHSQDSFKSFLHKECKRQGAALLGGSGAGDVDLACQVALTQWRTAQLKQQ